MMEESVLTDNLSSLVLFKRHTVKGPGFSDPERPLEEDNGELKLMNM